MVAGEPIRLDTGANVEYGTITAVGTAGATGTGVTLTAPLTIAHASGAAAQDLGSGITVTAPLTQAPRGRRVGRSTRAPAVSR